MHVLSDSHSFNFATHEQYVELAVGPEKHKIYPRVTRTESINIEYMQRTNLMTVTTKRQPIIVVTISQENNREYSMTSWPHAYCWLYTPFLLNSTTSEDFRYLQTVNGKFQLFVDQDETWKENDQNVSRAFVVLYKICADATCFPTWITYVLKKPNISSQLKNFNLNLAVMNSKMKPELYGKFFNNESKSLDMLSRITAVLDIYHVVEQFDAEGSFPSLVDAMKPYLTKQQTLFSNWTARCHFLLLLFLSDNSSNRCWYMELLRTLSTKATTRPVARFLEYDYIEQIENYEILIREAHFKNVKKVVNFADENEPSDPRPQKYFETEELRIERQYEDNIKLYDYQYELTNHAVGGDNTIVCAPTGSGKTVVAAFIIREHLRCTVYRKDVRRVVVLVPTIILVEQQANVLRKFLGSEFLITQVSGAEESYTSDNVLHCLAGDVVVMTPQVFLNLHKTPLETRKIYIRDFTLMVFDECHHCDKKHPYNGIMKNVLEKQIIDGDRTIPQVVGLTASVGVGNSRSLDGTDVMAHITSLCSRMGAVSISSVKIQKNLDELNSKVNKPVDDFITTFHNDDDPFAYEIARISDHIETFLSVMTKKLLELCPHLTPDKVSLTSKIRVKNGTDKTNKTYFNKLGNIKEYVKQSLMKLEDKEYTFWLLNYLVKLYNVLKYNELLPASAALKYAFSVCDNIDEIQNDKNVDLSQYKDKLKSVHQFVRSRLSEMEQRKIDTRNYAIDALLNQIKRQYDISPQSRILIFVDLRRGCHDLAKYLNQNPIVVKCFGSNKVTTLISSQKQNKKDDKYFVSRADQVKRREDFENGKINIIVTTSVADEGVDVAACNLVIKYNSSGNEKTYIQRRGRARGVGGRSVLIAHGSDTERREYNNIFRECIMKKCLKTLASLKKSDVRKKIDEQTQIRLEIEKRNAKGRTATSQMKSYRIRCCDCDTILGETNQLRFIEDETIVLCNPGIWKKIKTEKLERNQKNDNNCSFACAAGTCAKCNRVWGHMVKYADLYFLSPKIENIKIDDINMEKQIIPWKELIGNQFVVLKVQQTDLVTMYNESLGEKEDALDRASRLRIKHITKQNNNRNVEAQSVID